MMIKIEISIDRKKERRQWYIETPKPKTGIDIGTFPNCLHTGEKPRVYSIFACIIDSIDPVNIINLGIKLLEGGKFFPCFLLEKRELFSGCYSHLPLFVERWT